MSDSNSDQEEDDSNSEKSEEQINTHFNPKNGEIEQELRDLRDSDGEDIYQNVNTNVKRPDG
jgi:hypothetical protein